MIKVSVAINERALRKEIESTAAKAVFRESSQIANELSAETPIDTGLASKSWEVQYHPEGAIITNPVNYIRFLNLGTSKTPGRFFIERVLSRYSALRGLTIDYR
jgi:hypothetical protein